MRPASGGKRWRPWALVAVASGFVAALIAATVVIIRYTDKDGKPREMRVDVPGKLDGPPIVQEGNPPATIPTGEPMSPLALVRKPAKIAAVESWSIETVNPRGAATCCLSTDGRRVATCGSDGAIRVWNTSNGRLIQVLPGYSEGWGLAFSPDGDRVALLDGSGSIRVSSLASGKEIWKDTGNWGLVWSPDGTKIAAGRGKVVSLWDANSGERIDALPLSGSDSFFGPMSWSPSSKLLAIAHKNGVVTNASGPVEIWDAETGKPVATVAASGGVRGLAWSHDGTTLAVSEQLEERPSKLEFFDRAGGKPVHVIDGPPGGVPCFTKEDKTILWGTSEWNVADGKEVRPLQSERLLRLIPTEEKISGWAVSSWSADGRLFVTRQGGQGWNVYDAVTGKVVSCGPWSDEGDGFWDLSPDGRSLAQVSTGWYAAERALRIWDVPTARATVVCDSIPNPQAIKWSPDGKHLIVGCNSNKSYLFNSKSWQSQSCDIGGFSSGGGWLPPVWSLDGKTLAGQCGEGDSVQVWNVESGTGGRVLKGTPKYCASASLSPDGKWLALVSDEHKAVEIWDVTTGKKGHTLESENPPGHSCTWSPDGQYLASREEGPRDTVRIWDPGLSKTVGVLVPIDLGDFRVP